ncbi:MAG: hypothetical protein A3K30_03255 [Deltaproteobacteria bacterium RBG_13_51_10]|nr:MAG: hypothetical protein A3K30_03255 [Deltaproteobacteria bacterium RBG_13_51_10]
MLQNQSWINIEQSKFATEFNSKKDKRVEFRVFVSPYDIPEAVRGFMDQDKKRFVIEFRYISDESVIEKKIDDNVNIFIGNNSKRVYSIEVDSQALHADQISLKLISAIEATRKYLSDKEKLNANIDITKNIVNANWPKISKSMVQV